MNGVKAVRHWISGLAVGMLIVATPCVVAQTSRIKAAGVENLSVDEAFVQARQAVTQDNKARFDLLAVKAAQQPVLGMFVPYWKLRLALAQPRPEEGSDWAALDADVARYIERNSDSMAADLLRRDWILNLGRRGQWAALETLYPTWVLRDEAPSHCYGLYAQLEKAVTPPPKDSPVVLAAREYTLNTKDVGEACTQLLAGLMQRRLASRAEVFARVLATTEGNSLGSVRRLAGLLDLDAGNVEQALARPGRAMSLDRETELIGFTRLARQDHKEALQRLGESRLAGPDRAYVMGQIAAASMRKLEPEAIDYLRQSTQPQGSSEGRTSLPALASDDSIQWQIRAALRAQDWGLVRQFTSRLSATAQRDPTWVYWRARALGAQKRDEEAQALYRSIAGQHHFYGQLASEALGQLIVMPPRPAPVSDAEMAELEILAGAGFARALEFYRLGLRFEGNREWNYHVRNLSDRQLNAAAQWACTRRILDRCVNTADRTVQDHDFHLRFIQPFSDAMKQATKEQGVDMNWVYGLIRQESRFIMDARSHVGASGLMQLMPATARWVAKQAGMDGFRPEQVNDLTTNLKLGTFYLRSVLDDLDGSPLLASAAYNAGPNRPRTWRSSLPGQVEGAIFAEIIPFTETRDYVKKVLSNATYYAAINTGQPQSLLGRLGKVAPKAMVASNLP
jgi:soluble lytic murein transglycosylase